MSDRTPNRIVLAAAVLSLAQGVHASTGLLSGVLLVVLLLVVSLARLAALGMGDVKLALLLLCALGDTMPRALLIALELYALVALALLVRRGGAAFGTALPLAPIIAAGCLIVVLTWNKTR